MEKEKLKDFFKSFLKAGKSILFNMPVFVGILILMGLVKNSFSIEFYSRLFSNSFLDSFISAVFGSVVAGNPITSYILGGELLNQGISLIAVTSFLVSWVTVGVLQLPAEIMMLGKKYAITRNLLAFVSSIIVAIITVGVISLI